MKDNHEIILTQAFHISNHLILWNMPYRKKLLSLELRREVEERLWSKNSLDKMVYQKLGTWQEGNPTTLTELEMRELMKSSQELKEFIKKLEVNTIFTGELERNLKKTGNLTIKEWIIKQTC